MGYQYKMPTESDFAKGRVVIKFGTLVFLGAIASMSAYVFFRGKDVTLPGQIVRGGCLTLSSFGLACIFWGLRVYAQKAEFTSVSNSGVTPAYEGACTLIAILFAVAPILIGLLSWGII
jgi:hypothetical protein